MAIAIPLDRVQQVLAMRIGTALAHSGAGTHAAERLRHYRVGDDTIRNACCLFVARVLEEKPKLFFVI